MTCRSCGYLHHLCTCPPEKILPVSFENDGTEFSALYAAEKFCRDRGWSFGPTDVTGVRCVLFRPGVDVAKWKNLTPTERRASDAVITTNRAAGGSRTGTVTIERWNA